MRPSHDSKMSHFLLSSSGMLAQIKEEQFGLVLLELDNITPTHNSGSGVTVTGMTRPHGLCSCACHGPFPSMFHIISENTCRKGMLNSISHPSLSHSSERGVYCRGRMVLQQSQVSLYKTLKSCTSLTSPNPDFQ